jgi:hypothetical protein
MNDWDKIVREISYQTKSGSVDFTNPNHRYLLRKELMKLGWADHVIYEFMKKVNKSVDDSRILNEQEEKIPKISKATASKMLIDNSNGKLAKMSNSARVSNVGELTPKEFVKLIKSTFEGVKDVKVHEPGEQSSPGDTSSAYRRYDWKYGDNEIKVHLAGRVTGRGSAATKDQELSWLLVLSGLQYGLESSVKEEFISGLISNPTVYGKVDGMSESDAYKLAAYLEENDDWYKSHISQAEKFMSKVGVTNQPRKYVKDDSKLEINKLAKKLYQAEYGKTLDLDKWNPADVWLDYGSVPNVTKLSELNNFCLKSIAMGNGYIGVSLKKGSGKVGLVNGWTRKVYKLKKVAIRYGKLFSQGVTFDYSGENLDGLGLHYRVFQAKPSETIRGEGTAKGAEAVQGKVKMSVIDDFKSGSLSKIEAVKGVSVQLVQDPNSKNKKDKIYQFTSDGKKRFKKVQTAWKVVGKKSKSINSQGDYNQAFRSEEKFLEILNSHHKKIKTKENSIKTAISAKFQSIVLGSIVAGLRTDTEEVMLGLLKYGKSESDWSAPHYKAQ